MNTAAAVLFGCAVGQSASPTLTTLYAFTNGYDGGQPFGSVTLGSGGVLYGTAKQGGEYNGGVVFSLAPPESPGGAWTQTVLHEFNLVGDGNGPTAGMVIGAHGILYGTTEVGGTVNTGTVFSLKPPASRGGAWTYTTLYNFTGSLEGGPDGAMPSGNLVIGTGGVLYGTTWTGGVYALGTAFSLTPPKTPGGAWTETVLHSFGGANDGSEPFAGVVIGSGGVLYGTTGFSPDTTQYGSCCGTLFSLTPPASPGGVWTYALLYDFNSTGGAGGNSPQGGLTVGGAGVLYGTTCGGLKTLNPGGVVFSLIPPATPSGAWTESVLYNFPEVSSQFPKGGCPQGILALASGGALLGTTTLGGGINFYTVGTIFKLSPPASPGGTWSHDIISTFTETPGEPIVQTAPYAGVIIGADGVLYGTTTGTQFAFLGYGTVFSLTP